jgi:hypothetical protein
MTNSADSTPTITTKPRVMYLDVDDTLIVWSNDVMGFGAPRAADFVNWALEHFEVRWLTMWCPSGRMRQEGAEELSYRFGYKIAPEVFKSIRNPKGFIGQKTEAIDYDDPRPWVWVEDMVLPKEKMFLTNRKLIDNFYPTNVSTNRVVLQKTWRLLAERFELPGGPDKTYSKELDQPTLLLTVDDIMDKYRNGKMQTHDEERPPELQLPNGWNW